MHIYHALLNALNAQMIGVCGVGWGWGSGVKRESSGCWEEMGGGGALLIQVNKLDFNILSAAQAHPEHHFPAPSSKLCQI